MFLKKVWLGFISGNFRLNNYNNIWFGFPYSIFKPKLFFSPFTTNPPAFILITFSPTQPLLRVFILSVPLVGLMSSIFGLLDVFLIFFSCSCFDLSLLMKTPINYSRSGSFLNYPTTIQLLHCILNVLFTGLPHLSNLYFLFFLFL